MTDRMSQLFTCFCQTDFPITTRKQRNTYISLIASHGSPGFYARYGFEPALLPERAGMFLRIQG
ncbi:hypothetical protein KFO32_12765 [Pantoea ananatis]|uniref:hypothetical protein n=1 Tax=Pantoea ananas TaxID=553 RepID=UPI001FF1A766|nr:hypothetical protein [Pantoea ananatis]MCK0553920.1 hypothetical protein [Pantoea ananatis]